MSVIWHDLECGAYARRPRAVARARARSTAGPVLDIGAGTGRVALDLARARARVDRARPRRASSLAELARRARTGSTVDDRRRRRARVRARRAASRLIIVPMQTIQLLGGADGRAGSCAARARHLRPAACSRSRSAEALELYECRRARAARSPTSASSTASCYSSQPTAVRAGRRRGSCSSAAGRRSSRDGRRTSSRPDPARPLIGRPARARGRGRRARAGRARRDRADRDHVGSVVVMLECLTRLRVCALYPDLMNIYADRGNLLMLERRCALARDRFAARRERARRAARPRRRRPVLHRRRPGPRPAAVRARPGRAQARRAARGRRARGAVILAVCGGYQLLGHSYQLGDETLPGVGLLDAADGPRATARG